MRYNLLFLFSFFISLVSAQEVVIGLQSNPQLQKKISPQYAATYGSAHFYKYKELKKTLPFIDDFSSNHLKVFITDTTSGLFDHTEVYFEYEVNNVFLDTIKYSTSPTWIYEINGDSALNSTFTIYQYNPSIYPPVIYDSIVNVYPTYNIHKKLVGNPDTVSFNSLVLYNSTWYYHIFNDDVSYWTGRGVYVNSNYPINPISVGVATFDALDDDGLVYVGSNAIPKKSDSLVSKPFDLSSLTKTDNLFLSFYLESKGYGDAPETKDSLILQFLDNAGSWITVWNSNTIATWPADNFLSVYEKLDSSIYFHSAFKFRFVNHTSITGFGTDLSNRDNWHLDYVVFDKNRSDNDNYISDVAFEYLPKSLVNGYTSVPWRHFTSGSNVMQGTSQSLVRNTATTNESVDFRVNITEKGNVIYTSVATQNAIIPAADTNYYNENYGSFAYASAESDSASFIVQYVIGTTATGNFTGNDTVEAQQDFFNYYSFDDGTAEAGYGFYETGLEFAYKINILESKGDTLRGLWMYFNDVANHANYLNPFTIRVWADNAGVPGTLLLETSTMYPDTIDGINEFSYYPLSTELFLQGTYHVGFRQSTSSYINIGLDLNTNANSSMHYKGTDGWKNSLVQGAVMLRPVMGKKVVFPASNEDLILRQSFEVYPNPVTQGFFNIETESISVLSVVDVTGKEILTQLLSKGLNIVNTENLPSGIYFVKTYSTENSSLTVKKIIVQ